jgi:hypothetical protein
VQNRPARVLMAGSLYVHLAISFLFFSVLP